jgi:hypothetical protein
MDYCWVKTEFLELTYDVSSVAQIRTLLPYTEFYWAPRNVRASRLGDEVSVLGPPRHPHRRAGVYRAFQREDLYCRETRLLRVGGNRLAFSPNTHTVIQQTLSDCCLLKR